MTNIDRGENILDVQFEYLCTKADLVKSIYRKCYHWKSILGYYFVIAFIPHAVFGFIEAWLMKLDGSGMSGIYDKVMLIWHAIFFTWLSVLTIAVPVLIWFYARFVARHSLGANGFTKSEITVSTHFYQIKTCIENQPVRVQVDAPVQINMDNDYCFIMIRGMKQLKLHRIFITKEDWKKLRQFTRQCVTTNHDGQDL